MRTGSSSIATSTWMICANTKRKHCDVGLSPDLFSLAPCSPPSRPLRAASGGGLRPVLTTAARGALSEGRSGRRDGSVRSNKGMLAFDLSSASPPPMTDMLNFAHTTARRVDATHSRGYIVHASLTTPSPRARRLSRCFELDLPLRCSQRAARLNMVSNTGNRLPQFGSPGGIVEYTRRPRQTVMLAQHRPVVLGAKQPAPLQDRDHFGAENASSQRSL